MSVQVNDRVKIKGTDIVGRVSYIARSKFEVQAESSLTVYILPEQALEVLPKPPEVGDVIENESPYNELPVGAVVAGNWTPQVVVRVQGGFIDPAHPERVLRLGWFSNPRKLVYLPES